MKSNSSAGKPEAKFAHKIFGLGQKGPKPEARNPKPEARNPKSEALSITNGLPYVKFE